jgi:PEGA domain
VSPGEHTLVVRRPGYTEFSQRVTVEAGQLTEVVATLEPSVGVVAVTVDVPGASVLIDSPSGTCAATAPATV